MINLLFIFLILLNAQFAFATVRSFDGTNDEVTMGDILDVTSGDISLCIWTLMTEDASADLVLGKKNDLTFDTAGYAIYQASTDLMKYEICDNTIGFICVESTSTTDVDGVWAFVCGTYNGSTQTTIMYINETQENTDSNILVGADLSNAITFETGETGNAGNDMAGLAAYAQQFAAVLTQVEISQIRWRPDTIVASIGGFWPYWGDNPEQDLSGNNNDGTITNATTNAGGPPIMIGDAAI